jgi:hypothetical protein
LFHDIRHGLTSHLAAFLPLPCTASFSPFNIHSTLSIAAMMLSQLVLALAAVHGATAHFGLTYPAWRADTLAAETEAKYSQWDYPCMSSHLLVALP